MDKPFLHITNGGCAADLIQHSGIPGQVMAWEDVLHEGPVPALPLNEFSIVRAHFLSSLGWGDNETIVSRFQQRDSQLEQFNEYAEVVLWFEHDLYDQLQLIQILDWFHTQPKENAISLICDSHYVSYYTPQEIPGVFTTRNPISSLQYELAHDAWSSFTASDPNEIQIFLQRDSSSLPFLRPAFIRLLQQFPSTVNGLNRTEQQALEVISQGSINIKEVFKQSQHNYEEALFLGDSTFAHYLEQLSQQNCPLICLENGDPIKVPAQENDLHIFWNQSLRLTDAGFDVMIGKADRISLIGFDRWIGGAHLQQSQNLWRWNEHTKQLIHE